MFVSVIYHLILCASVVPTRQRTFSTYTAYDQVRGDIRKQQWPNYLTPLKLYLIARHGSRHLGDPNHEFMMGFLTVLEKNPQLASQYPWIDGWVEPAISNDKELVPQGMLEHYRMGSRFRDRFPDLLVLYDPETYSNRATFKHRTSQSSSAFMNGLFENTGPISSDSTNNNVSYSGYQPVATENASPNLDTLLRFYDNCPSYLTSQEFYTAEDWMNKFFKTREFELQVVHVISQKIGIKITSEESLGLFFLCALETYSPTTLNNSKFCELLPEAASDYIEYCYDLQHYLAVGYLSNLGYKASCTIVSEMINIFKDTSRVPKVALRFGHRETLQPLATLLGLYENQTVTKFEELKTDRSYKGAEIVPFAGNIAFILFNDTLRNKNVIKIYLNEKPVNTPICSSGEDCTLYDFEMIINTVNDKCNFAEMCGYDDGVVPVEKQLGENVVMLSSWILLGLVAFSFFSACYMVYTLVTWVNMRYDQMRDGYEEIALLDPSKHA